jgi:rare lipoprotein A
VLARYSKLLWVVLLACAFLALDTDRAEAREVLASWYGPGFHGQPTASGEPYNAYGYTAAHKTMPLGTRLVVSYGGRSVQVRVNDRGPFVGGRELDLSQGAAEHLGLTRAGVDYVDYRRAGGGYGTNYGYGGGYGVDRSTVDRAAYSGTTDRSAYSSRSGYENDSTGARAETGGGAYVVQPGDTLSELALQLGTTVDTLAAANGIANPDLIYIGQTIYY